MYALIVGHLGELVHLRAAGTPWIVAGRLANFRLGVTVPLGIVLSRAQGYKNRHRGAIGKLACGLTGIPRDAGDLTSFAKVL